VFTLGGGNGLATALQQCGIEQIALEQLAGSEVDALANAAQPQPYPLVMGWTREYDYELATRVLRLERCISGLYSTGADRCFPGEAGSMPGLRWMAGSVEALLRKAAFNPAKPSRYALDYVLRMLGQPPAQTLVIGDSVSDIQTGNSAGCRTVLVLGGATTHGELEALTGDSVPQQVIAELTDLL
jgi:ribonucleotide monophosphatase NagD (HAD superfamily)